MLKYFALPAMLLVSACGGDPVPELDTTGGLTVQKSRIVIIKGEQGTGMPTIPPSLSEWTYPVTCAPGNTGGTPQQRADRVMAVAKAASGQVKIRIGPQYMRSSEARRINAVTIPQLRCQVGYFSERQIGSGETTVIRWAIENGAMQEIIANR